MSAIASHQKKALAGHTGVVDNILCLPGGQRIISYSRYDSSLRVWDLESETQVEEAWKDDGSGGVPAIALSPDGKEVASGYCDGSVRLWDIETGKVMKKWTGHTKWVQSVCWSRDGRRVVSGSEDQTFRVWDVENGKTILILATLMSKEEDDYVWAICDYSPDGEMIATGGDNYGLKIWDANTGELLKTFEIGFVQSLAWTSDGGTLIAGGTKFETTTWTETASVFLELEGHKFYADAIALSPNERILTVISTLKQTAQLWNIANGRPIALPLRHEDQLSCAASSADGKLLVIGCNKGHIYIWDVFAIIREAGLEDLLSDNNTVNEALLDADATRRRARPLNDARRIPRGFFGDTRDFETSPRVASHGQRDRRTLSTRTFLLGRLTSLWRRPDTTERETISRPHPLSWVQHFIPSMSHKRSGTVIELRETPVVEVPYTRGKPRNYHAGKKPSASSSRPPNPHSTQQPSAAIRNTPSSSQRPTAAALTSEALPTVATTTFATETMSQHNITVTQAGSWTRLLLWIGCASVEYTDDRY